jgi:methionine-rich copper-binding protein CopC
MSPIEIGPERRGIMLWSWRSGSKTPPPLLLFGGLMLFVGSLFLLLMGNYAYKEHRLSSEGMLTDGIVVKKVLHQASDNGTSKTSYEVDYTFTAADGRKIAGHDTVDPDVWDQIREGGPVQIDYAASKPQINQIGPASGNAWAEFLVLGLGSVIWLLGAILTVKGLRARSSAQAGIASRTASEKADVQADLPPFVKKLTPSTVFGSILLFIGAIFLLVGVFNLQQERAFRAEGRTAAGIVLTKSTHVEYDHQNNTQHTHYDIGYRFTADDGTSVRGSAELNWRTWTSIHERDPIQITYLPAHPSKNRLAADRPGFLLWLITVLGGLLTAGGVILIGYGALRRARRCAG